MNEIIEHLKRKFGLTDEDYNALVEVERNKEKSVFNRLSNLEESVGVGNNPDKAPKGLAHRLDAIEERLTLLEANTTV